MILYSSLRDKLLQLIEWKYLEIRGAIPFNDIKEDGAHKIAGRGNTHHILIKVLGNDSRYLVTTNTLLSMIFPLAHLRFSTTAPKYVQSLYTFFSSLPLTGLDRWIISILPIEESIPIRKSFTRQL